MQFVSRAFVDAGPWGREADLQGFLRAWLDEAARQR